MFAELMSRPLLSIWETSDSSRNLPFLDSLGLTLLVAKWLTRIPACQEGAPQRRGYVSLATHETSKSTKRA